MAPLGNRVWLLKSKDLGGVTCLLSARALLSCSYSPEHSLPRRPSLLCARMGILTHQDQKPPT
jgi:hypothetical protein